MDGQRSSRNTKGYIKIGLWEWRARILWGVKSRSLQTFCQRRRVATAVGMGENLPYVRFFDKIYELIAGVDTLEGLGTEIQGLLCKSLPRLRNAWRWGTKLAIAGAGAVRGLLHKEQHQHHLRWRAL